MTEHYGIGSWGTGSWGSDPQVAGVDEIVPDNTGTPDNLGGFYEERGGTIARITGTNFQDPLILLIYSDAAGLDQVGQSYMGTTRYDLTGPKGRAFNKALVGMPALPAGVYTARVSNNGIIGLPQVDAIEYKLFARQYKIQKIRSSFARAWDTGDRILTNAVTGSTLGGINL